MKLLIADDNKNIRTILKSICSELFTEIIECDNGASAVEYYESEKPDWVLMDIKMKKMDGISAAQKILSRDPSGKIIFVSQFNEEAFVDAAMKIGAVDYINKEDLTKIEDIIKSNEVT